MSSGTLPFQQYHRTSHLGEGTFGSVVIVYNNDGAEYAMKLFMDDTDDTEKDDNDDSSSSSYRIQQPINIGTLREISCLRLLRGENAHPNIIEMVDIQPKNTSTTGTNEEDDDEDDNECGAGTSNYIGMTIPYVKYGSIKTAIQQQTTFQSISKREKVVMTFELLSAIDYLHNICGIIHRDIKSDNILLQYNTELNRWKPILIDFSLAKPISAVMWGSCDINSKSSSSSLSLELEHIQHTGEVGTMIYTAPEVMTMMIEESTTTKAVQQTHGYYGTPIDLYSTGVVLLEMHQNFMFTAEKYKEAQQQIQTSIQQYLSGGSSSGVKTSDPPLHQQQKQVLLPYPKLLRQLLEIDPDDRITASEAIQHEVFHKFNILHDKTNYIDTNQRRLDIGTALPYDENHQATGIGNDENNGICCSKANDENNPPSTQSGSSINRIPASSFSNIQKANKTAITKKYEQRLIMIDRILKEFDSDHPVTRSAALEYSIQLEQIDEDIDADDDDANSGTNNKKNKKNSNNRNTHKNKIPSQSLIDCCIVAYRFFELNVLDIQNLHTAYSSPMFQYWDYDTYIENEITLFMLLDYCLYPRTLL